MDDDLGILVVISYEESALFGKLIRRRRLSALDENYRIRFNLDFYRNNLQCINSKDMKGLDLVDLFYNDYGGIFLKSIYLKNGYSILIYISYQSLIIDLVKLNYALGGTIMYSKNDINIYMNFLDEFLSDLVKLNEQKVAFVCTKAIIRYNKDRGSYPTNRNLEITGKILYILIIDITSGYWSFSLNQDIIYKIYLGNLLPYFQISAFAYNGFLFLATTTMYEEEIHYSEAEINYFSTFMIFGYPNGTDYTSSAEDIEYLLYGEDDYIFVEYLCSFLVLENNLFGYYSDRIKLISVPEEIIITERMYIGVTRNLYSDEDKKMTNNSYMFDDYDYIFSLNETLIKTTQYYYLDYQFIVKEKCESESDILDEDSLEQPLLRRRMCSNCQDSKLYYGRINRLKFKLCHEFCETCYEFGYFANEQKCLSCLPNYQYDYFYYSNEPNENCVPEGYYYDKEVNELIKCNSTNSKFYLNITNNKRICFKDTYDCPFSYPTYNETLKECFICDYKRVNKGDCSFEELPTTENYFESDINEIIETSDINEITFTSSNIIIKETINECLVCDYNCYIRGKCSFDNNETSEDIYEKIKNDFISNYKGEEGYLKVSNGNDFAFQITTVDNELNDLKNNIKSNFSVIDLKDCADLLKSQYGLDNDTDLIILKYENENTTSNGNEKSVQYEVYLPNSNIKLNLSVCSNTNIDLYVPIQLSEDKQKLYDDLKAQGYNLFDKNDKFYQDICTPYKSENGTDVLLSDRINDFFEPNQLVCQENCQYSDYSPNSSYLKCECNVVDEEEINTKEPEKITAKSIAKSLYNILKYSNYKVLKCYKLVFRKITIRKNIGSILSNIYFIGYLIAFGFFCYKKLFYLQSEILKLFKNKDINDDKINKNNPIIYNKNIILNTENIVNYNLDKRKIKVEKNISSLKIDKTKIKFENRIKEKNKNLRGTIDIKQIDSYKELNIKTLKSNFNDSVSIASNEKLPNKIDNVEKGPINEINKKLDDKKLEVNEKITEKKGEENLTDYELNDLEYLEALEKDNRNFLKIYWYLLKREHLLLFTFYNWKDFNLFSIKLSKLFLSICTDMAFNVFFFSDDSMHNIYISGGEHDFIGQLAQMIYSTIVSQILQIFISYLTMTDIHYYQIKELKKEKNITSKQTIPIIKCIKIKIIVYHIFTFLLFLFFWYLISAFCAVYENTQRIFLTDSISSFIMGLVYPFALYLAPTALRVISLKAKEKKNLKFLYTLSDKIPFF